MKEEIIGTKVIQSLPANILTDLRMIDSYMSTDRNVMLNVMGKKRGLSESLGMVFRQDSCRKSAYSIELKH